jgi:hypothetical protein
MMLARKLPYFNTKTLTLNLANLQLGEGFIDFPFILFQSSFYFILFFDFMTCNDGKQKHAVEGVNKNMVDERERDANGGEGQKIKYEITTYLFFW